MAESFDRRAFLVAAAAGSAALSSRAQRVSSARRWVRIHLAGGPSHVDLFDPKSISPFGSIPTRIPGVRLSALLPRVAARLDRFCLIRSVTGMVEAHAWPFARSAGRCVALEDVNAALEAGATNLAVRVSGWDLHADLVHRLPPLATALDHALADLFDGLRAWGLWDETQIIVSGEFGRSPILNRHGGRDHWPAVMTCILAGGGMPSGHVIGATDSQGCEPVRDAVTWAEVQALLA
jgi:hypothetical protein